MYSFLKSLLCQNRCIDNGEVIEENRGAMAGVPLASFFANIYLLDLDRHFEKRGIPYFRYSDDMILFFRNEEQLKENEIFIRAFLAEKKLNEAKAQLELYQVLAPIDGVIEEVYVEQNEKAFLLLL